jgi:PAS domain S-box-containing protein
VFRAIFENAPYAIVISRLSDGRYLDANPTFLKNRGLTRDDLRTLNFRDHARISSEEAEAVMNTLTTEGSISHRDVSVTDPDGRVRHLSFSSVLMDIDGQQQVLSMTVDLTTQKNVELAHKQSEERFRSLFRFAPIPLISMGLDGSVLAINDRLTDVLGYEINDFPDEEAWWTTIYPDPDYRRDIRQRWDAAVKRALERGSGVESDECRVTCRDGRVLSMIVEANVIGDILLVSFFDITEVRLKESALKESMEQLRATFNATTDGILVVSQDLKVIQANRQFYAMWRIPPELQATDDDVALRDFVKDQLADPPGFTAMVQSLYHSRTQAMYELPMIDGRVFECYTAPMIMDDREIGRVWDFRDISERRRAEEQREKLQAQLHQSKKLEAVGILAGGVAHDFNNMLGAITGYAEITLAGMTHDDPFRKNLVRILDAAQRSANLTRQLLAFARKQTIEPVVLDLNQAIESILSMIRRIIGENIELIWRPSADPCPVKMDPSQLDQILINLCVNARDAIGDVGRLTLETDIGSFDAAYCERHPEFLPGDYALLSVSDSGRGMSPDILAHIFEPFYTTKGLGQGTGMGLATVYGIVKQNGGVITVSSEPLQGTLFLIHIPLVRAAVVKPREPIGGIPEGHGETILIVEDDPTLLELCSMMLQQLGYTVLAAGSPAEALRLIETHEGTIDLIITDVIMPGMNGRELSDRIEGIRPGIQHLFMSGYTADAIAHQGVLEAGVHFIQKPFGLQPLAVKIREILE